MTIGGPAATFAQQFRQELFPGTPTLIAGVDRRFVEHGTFTAQDTAETAMAVLCYAVGLWAFGGVRIIVAAFYFITAAVWATCAVLDLAATSARE